jgi:hypothetical protein
MTIAHGWSFFVFGLKEVIRWVRASTPVRCSPRGLEGMSYPFKGFKSSVPIWGRRDVMLGYGYRDASYPDVWDGEVPWCSHVWGTMYLVAV